MLLCKCIIFCVGYFNANSLMLDESLPMGLQDGFDTVSVNIENTYVSLRSTGLLLRRKPESNKNRYVSQLCCSTCFFELRSKKPDCTKMGMRKFSKNSNRECGVIIPGCGTKNVLHK